MVYNSKIIECILTDAKFKESSVRSCIVSSAFPGDIDVGQGDAIWMVRRRSEWHVRERSVCKVCSHGRNLRGHNAT